MLAAVRLGLIRSAFPTIVAAALVLVTQPSATNTTRAPDSSVGGSCYVDTYGWGGIHLTLWGASCRDSTWKRVP